jgi:imidazole glycerol-phosphate synthase subunit HisH
MSKIGVVDYGGGNIQSVRNAMRACDTEFIEIESPERLEEVSGLVFPGQGAFADSMAALHERKLVEPLRDWLRADRPFFGICIGYQVLFESSEEAPGVEGLGIFPGRVERFPASDGVKIPHMGWNTAHIVSPNPAPWDGLGNDPFFYFVHSFFPVPADPTIIATTTQYAGLEFASSIQRGQIIATQFHPEKSQANGIQLLKNFADRFR